METWIWCHFSYQFIPPRDGSESQLRQLRVSSCSTEYNQISVSWNYHWLIEWLIDWLILSFIYQVDVKFKETNRSAVMLNCMKVQQLTLPLSTYLRRRFQLIQRMWGSELEPFFPIWCVIVLVRGNELKNMCVCVFLGSSPVGHDVLWCHHILGMLRSLLLFFSAPPPGAAQ